MTTFISNSDYTIDLPEGAHCLQAKIKRIEFNNTVITYATWVHRQAPSFSSFNSKQVGFIKINCQQYPSKYYCKFENSRLFLYIHLWIQTSLKGPLITSCILCYCDYLYRRLELKQATWQVFFSDWITVSKIRYFRVPKRCY